MTETIYISIGNTDNKLTQQQWAAFHNAVDGLIRRWAVQIYGAWVSPSVHPYQNACWCIQWDPEDTGLKKTLAKHAAEYLQDSIAWAVAVTEFIERK